MADPKTDATADKPLNPELDRHLSDPAEKTEEVAGEQERAKQHPVVPTDPNASTEQQPT